MRKCPRCSCEVGENSSTCPKCGLSVAKMDAFEKSISNMEFERNASATDPTAYLRLSREEKKALKKEKKLRKKQEKKDKKIRRSISDTDFSVYATNGDEYKERAKNYTNNFSGRRLRYKDNNKFPEFTIDPNGEFNIDTSDVEIVGEQTGRMIEEQHQSYSVKKSRGDYNPPKIKWWEIYKLADRHFARRKIKKQITKASKIKPGFISKTKLFLLSLFFGWTGAHNFYAKNYKKGWLSIFSLISFILIMIVSDYSRFFASIQISIGGFLGFVNIFIWIFDTINIAINSFKYRIQKEAFLFRLNFNTRAKLGEKYYDLELYQKPWWTRFAAWCKRRKRDIDVALKEHKQNKIEKQKKKLQKQQKENSASAADTKKSSAKEDDGKSSQKSEEKSTFESEMDSIESEEKKRKEKIRKQAEESIDFGTLSQIDSFDGGKTISASGKKESAVENLSEKAAEGEKNDSPKPLAKNRVAKVKVSTKNKKNKK